MINLTLIVDDNKMMQHSHSTMLQRMGVCQNFEFASNGKEAMKYLRYCLEKKNERLPDLILMDLHMPIMNGWQFLEEYRKLSSQIKKTISVFVLSSSIDKGEIIRVKNSPVVLDFIAKPLAKEDVEMIATTLEYSQHLQVQELQSLLSGA